MRNTNINLTAKIITTDTAEIIGAAKAGFAADNTVQQFLSSPARTESADQPASALPPELKKPFGDRSAKIESFLLSGNNVYGIATMARGAWQPGFVQKKSCQSPAPSGATYL